MKKTLDIYLLESKFLKGSYMASSSPAKAPCGYLKTIGIARGVEINFKPYENEIDKDEYNAKLQKQIDDLEAQKL